MYMIFTAFVIVLLVFAFFLAIGLIDGNRFEVVKEEIVLPKLKKECRLVLISDLHNKVYGDKNDVLIKAIKKINPDFIILAGDLVTSKAGESIKPGAELVKIISSEYKIYYGMGNHESKLKQQPEKYGTMYTDLKNALPDSSVVVLENKSTELAEYNIRITGLELPLDYFAHFRLKEMRDSFMNELVGEADRSKCNILIAHNPDYFSKYADWGADLVLSGHVHGGIMRLPVLGGVIAPSYSLFPKYDGGIFRENGSVMLLGRGMGAHTIPLRFFNPAQLYSVTIKPEKR